MRGELVQALVGHQLERLVADLRQAHVADVSRPLAAQQRRDLGLEVVDVGHERVDHHDELGPGLHRDVDVGGRDDPPVDELSVAHLDRRVDHRQCGRGAHRLGDRDVVPRLDAEDDPLTCVEVRRRDEELVLERAEVIGAVVIAEDLAQVALDAGARVHARRKAFRRPDDHIHGRDLAELAGEVAGQAGDPQRHDRRALGEVDDVRAQQRVEVDIAERRGAVLVDDPHHLLGRHPVGRQGGDERAGRGPHIDVELVDVAVDREEVEGAQGADLVDGPGEAAAAEHQRGLGAPPPATGRGRLGCRPGLALRRQRDHVVHNHKSIAQLGGAGRVTLP